MITHLSSSEEETQLLAQRLAPLLGAGDLVTFEGALGTGKTFFIRALCEALEVPREAGVSSPSYSLVHQYFGGHHPVAHLDLYRLEHEDDLEGIGFRDLLDGSWLVLVEWPDQVGGLGEVATLEVRLEDRGPRERQLSFRSPPGALREQLELAFRP